MKTMILAAVAMMVAAGAAVAEERLTDAQMDSLTAGLSFSQWVATRPLMPLPPPIAIVAPADFGALSNDWVRANQEYAQTHALWFETGPLFDVD